LLVFIHTKRAPLCPRRDPGCASSTRWAGRCAEAARFLARIRTMVDKRVYDSDDDLVQAPPWPPGHRPRWGTDGSVLYPAEQW
jgi:hypothetical protein